MPPSVDDAPDLSGLIELSRVEHLDLKPVILRVQTDLFVRAERPDRAAFEALACGLIPTVDDETVRIVAGKLAPCPGTPDAVLAALAARDGEARDTVVACAPRLSARVLDAAVSDGADIAAALAARPDLDGGRLDELSHLADPEVDRVLAGNGRAPLRGAALARLVTRARSSPDLARTLLARPDLAAADLAPLYLHAGPTRRAGITEAVEATAALRPCPPPPRGLGRQLLDLSEPGSVGPFLEHLADGLGLPRGFLAGASPDPGVRYDLLTLALRAADLREEEAVYVFLTLNEGVARSAARVFELVRLFRTISRPAARDLVAAILDHAVRERALSSAAHQPHHGPEARIRGTERGVGRPVQPALATTLPTRLRRTS